MLEENPPLPEEQAALAEKIVSRKIKVIAEEDIILGE
jgi:hypothetical protein